MIICALAYLYTTIGWSVFAGFAVMVLAIPVNKKIADYLRDLQARQMKHKDDRLKLMVSITLRVKRQFSLFN